jgi:hypothetical protein
VNDVGVDAARDQPTCQPEAVAAGLKGDYNTLDPASCFLRFFPPSMQQLQQCALVDREFFQRLALDARYNTGNEPARQAHLNDRNQRAARFEDGERSTQVVQLLHGALHRFASATMDAISSPPPHSIFHAILDQRIVLAMGVPP